MSNIKSHDKTATRPLTAAVTTHLPVRGKILPALSRPVPDDAGQAGVRMAS